MHTVNDDFGDEHAGDGPSVSHKVDGGLQRGQPPSHVRTPAGEQRPLS